MNCEQAGTKCSRDRGSRCCKASCTASLSFAAAATRGQQNACCPVGSAPLLLPASCDSQAAVAGHHLHGVRRDQRRAHHGGRCAAGARQGWQVGDAEPGWEESFCTSGCAALLPISPGIVGSGCKTTAALTAASHAMLHPAPWCAPPQDVSSTEAAIIYTLEPVFGGALAYGLLGER